MADVIKSLLTDVAKGFFGNDYLRDYTHASKTFRPNNYAYAPKFKHLFHVYFDINTDQIPASKSWPTLAEDKNFGLAVKSVKLPSYSFDLHTMNQYNRKRIVQTKIKYDPISIAFHDDNKDLIRKLWHTYYTYYYKDAATPDMSPGITSGRDIYDPVTTTGHDWGYIGEGTSPATGNNIGSSKPSFFRTINVYGFNQHNFSLYTYVNPIIENFSHDTYNYAENGTMENTMSIQYETVKYYSGAINGRSPGEIVKQFGDVAHYDRTLSPIAMPGTNASILGPNGLLDTASGIIDDLTPDENGNINILGAIRSGGSLLNTFKNPKSLLNAAKSDALGLAADTIRGTPNRNTLFNFPAASSSVVTQTNNALGTLFRGVATKPQVPPGP
jgi:hypothetical protein